MDTLVLDVMEKGAEELDSLLQQRGREGQFVDSSSFTIDVLKAREKLSRYQLSDSGLWLVKCVQAAVAAGAPDISINFGRRKVRVAFTPEQEWDAEAILDSLFHDQPPTSPALAHLGASLLGASGGLSQTLRWSVGATSVELRESNSQISKLPRQSEFVLEATRPSRGISWGKLLSSDLGHLLKQTVEEWSAVSARCWSSPIPIKLDGAVIRQGYDAVPAVRLHEKVPRRTTGLHRCLASRSLSEPRGRPSLPPELGEHSELSVSSDRGIKDLFGTFLRWRPSGTELQGVLSLHSSVMVGPTVTFVCDGAVVETRLIEPMLERLREFSFATRPLLMPRYVFAVRPEELDLGEFAVRDIDHLHLVRSCLPESLQLIEMVESRLGEYRARAADEMTMIKHGLKILLEMFDRVRSSETVR